MESWWPQSAWLSSGTAIFLLLNALVGIVAVMSRGQQGGHGRRLCRSASSMVLDRLRSFSSIFSVHPAAECYYHTTSEAGELRVDEAAPEQAVLEGAAAEPPRAPAATAAAAGAVACMSETETDKADEKCPSLDERNVQGQQHHAQAKPSPPAASSAGEASSAVAKGAGKEQPAKETPESSCARACRREEQGVLEGKAELNARAEMFIHQFREELKLQRLNSIINYTRGIRRRAGAALLPQD